jgi:hypothetical protein
MQKKIENNVEIKIKWKKRKIQVKKSIKEFTSIFLTERTNLKKDQLNKKKI